MFDQKQMQEFKEAFGLMDQDRDGSISLDDLKEVYSSLGKAPKDSDLKEMLEDMGGPVNFTKLLQVFGDRLNGLRIFQEEFCSYFLLLLQVRMQKIF